MKMKLSGGAIFSITLLACLSFAVTVVIVIAVKFWKRSIRVQERLQRLRETTGMVVNDCLKSSK